MQIAEFDLFPHTARQRALPESGSETDSGRIQFEFVEWTPDNHLRHSRFVALREDKKPRDVVREV